MSVVYASLGISNTIEDNSNVNVPYRRISWKQIWHKILQAMASGTFKVLCRHKKWKLVLATCSGDLTASNINYIYTLTEFSSFMRDSTLSRKENLKKTKKTVH